MFGEENVQHLGKNGQVWDYSSASSSMVLSLGLSVELAFPRQQLESSREVCVSVHACAFVYAHAGREGLSMSTDVPKDPPLAGSHLSLLIHSHHRHTQWKNMP